MEDFCETLTTEIKKVKTSESEMKNTINEIGNMLHAMNNSMEEGKE